MTGSRTLVRQRGLVIDPFSADSGGFYDDGSGPGSGTAAGFPQRDGAHHGRRAPGPGRRRCARHRGADRGGRPEPAGARRHRGDRRDRRHRHAGHDRHPPAHVADGHAGLRGRLDPHPVLRLVLPELGQEVPPAGRLRREPAVGHRVDRRRRDDHGGLVARAADDRPRRRRHRRPGGGAADGSCWPTGTSSRARGSGAPRRSSGTSTSAGSTARATWRGSRSPSTSPATTRRSRRRPRSRWPGRWACR